MTSVLAELRGLTVLEGMYLSWNQLTSVPAELRGLTSLLAALPEELGQLSHTHGGICTIRHESRKHTHDDQHGYGNRIPPSRPMATTQKMMNCLPPPRHNMREMRWLLHSHAHTPVDDPPHTRRIA
jgi:hypothetical protein